MSKTHQERLQRLESFTGLIGTAATVTLSVYKNIAQFLRTTLNTAQTINIPAATGKNGSFNIYVGVTKTGNQVVKAAGTTLFQGVAVMAGGTSGTFPSAANTNTITFNGTTQGGIIGSLIELRDVAPGVYQVKVHGVGSGVQVTPFSNT